jgi:hypothetical protein
MAETQTQAATSTAATPPPVTTTSTPTPVTDTGTQGGATGAGQQAGGTEGKTGTAQSKPIEAAPADFQLKLPEALQKDEASVTQFKAMAKELQLSGEQAQKLLDSSYALSEKKASEAKSSWEKQQKEWTDAAKADKEYGGADFEKNVSIAKKAIAKFTDEETRTFLNESGLGNHPGLLRAFFRAGKSIAEDSIATTPGGSKGATSDEERLSTWFPNMNKPPGTYL